MRILLGSGLDALAAKLIELLVVVLVVAVRTPAPNLQARSLAELWESGHEADGLGVYHRLAPPVPSEPP